VYWAGRHDEQARPLMTNFRLRQQGSPLLTTLLTSTLLDIHFPSTTAPSIHATPYLHKS
jgi:hypothetical protein